MLKINKGITVIALTITIAVLLVLVGITIVITDNEMIELTKEATDRYKEAEQEEIKRGNELKNYKNGKYAESPENDARKNNFRK